MELVVSRYYQDVVHIVHFNAPPSYFTSDRGSSGNIVQTTNLFKRLVEDNLNKFIQITLIPSQFRTYKFLLPIMKELGFKILFLHKNPNTQNIVTMLGRHPDNPSNLSAVNFKEFSIPQACNDEYRSLYTNHHAGYCCGYTDITGFTLKNTHPYTRDNAYEKTLMTSIYQILGETVTRYKSGQAFQIFIPSGYRVQEVGFYTLSEKLSLHRVTTYFNPNNRLNMSLYVSAVNKQPLKSWEDYGVFMKEEKEEFAQSNKDEKKSIVKGPARDATGRFSPKPPKLPISGSVGDMSYTLTFDLESRLSHTIPERGNS